MRVIQLSVMDYIPRERQNQEIIPKRFHYEKKKSQERQAVCNL